MITAQQLRTEAPNMTIQEMIEIRDLLEEHWTEDKRPLMQILTLAAINKHGKPVSQL